MKRVYLAIITVLLVVFSIFVLNKYIINGKLKDSEFNERMYKYLLVQKNQKSVYTSAINLNEGKSENTCVYFLSEVLRRNNYDVPKETCNTSQMISLLEKKGWRKDKDYKNLKPGDVCFTTDNKGNKSGVPTHTYIFMGWVSKGNYDNAYICDNQAKDYNNKIYHIRNIKAKTIVKGVSKDAFSFYMRNKV